MLVNEKEKREKIKINLNGQDKEKGIEEDEEGIDVEERSLLLKERISYFNGKYFNPIRSFSMKELKNATDDYNTSLIFDHDVGNCIWYKGSLEGRTISVRTNFYEGVEMAINEIAIASQMSAHKNALKLLRLLSQAHSIMHERELVYKIMRKLCKHLDINGIVDPIILAQPRGFMKSYNFKPYLTLL
ncbi:hypothetical protein AAG906_021075 [Vitis piasezkii]